MADRLRAGWSPQQTAGRLRHGAEANGKKGGRLCHETTGRHVYGPKGQAEQLHLCLPRARRRRGVRHGRRPREHRILLERGTACRPAEVIHRRGPWRNLEAVEYATLEWAHWFNTSRLLEPIGNIPPAEAEANHHDTRGNLAMAA